MSRDGASGLPATVWYNVGDSSGQHASSRHRNDNKREKSPSYSPEPKQNGHEKRRLSEEFKQSKETIIKLEKDVKAQKRYLEDTLIKHANEKQALEREIERLRHQTEPDEDDMSELREQISDKDEVICKLEHQVELTVQELKKVTDHSKSISQELCKLKSAQEKSHRECQEITLLQTEKEELQQSLTRVGQRLTILEDQNLELLSELEAAKQTACIYKEDFDKEREDRQRIAGKMESLERKEQNRHQKDEKKHLQKELQLLKEEKKQLQKDAHIQKEENKHLHKEVLSLKEENKQLQRNVQSQSEEVKHLQREAYSVKEEKKQLQKELQSQKEESRKDTQAKIAQVKQYKKQADELQAKIFRLEKEGKEKPNEHKGYILRRGQKKDEKVKVKEGLRSAKQQQEKKMKKEREERRKTMASLDKSSLVSYLQQEIARLEDENQFYKNNWACSDAACQLLVDKLGNAEARINHLEVIGGVNQAPVEIPSDSEMGEVNQTPAEIPSDSEQHRNNYSSSSKTHPPYVNLEVLESKPAAQQTHLIPPPPPPPQLAKPATDVQLRESPLDTSDARLYSKTANYVNLSSQSPSLDVPQTVTVTPADQGVVNESQLSASIAVPYNRAQIIPPPQLAKPATDVRLRKSQFDASDGRLHSKTADYVNLLPESPSLDVPQTVTVTPAQGVVNESQLSVSMAVPHNRAQITPRDCVSLPLDQIPVACQGDISSSIDAEISQEASDVATATGEYKRRTLDHVPFDPFLSCLYCNKMFRFGEIQKYRKHVSTCTGYTAQK